MAALTSTPAEPPTLAPAGRAAAPAGRAAAVGAVCGVVGVVAAGLVGLGLAAAAVGLGLSATAVPELAGELTSLGLLGSWQQRVSSSVGVDWTSTLRVAPVLVTVTMALVVARLARRSGPATATATATAAGAAAGALLASLVVVRLGTATTSGGNDVGTVQTVTGPDLLGTAVGAALVAGLAVAALRLPRTGRWATGRRDAMAVLVWAPLVLTVLVGGVLVWLTSSPSLAAAVVVVLPLAGSQLLMMLAGAPLDLGLPRITDGVGTVWSPGIGLAAATAGLVVSVLVALLAGLVRRRRRGRTSGTTDTGAAGVRAEGPAAVWGAGIGLGLVLLTGVHGALPDGLGGAVVVAVPWWAAVLWGAALAALSSWVAGRRSRVRAPSAEPADQRSAATPG